MQEMKASTSQHNKKATEYKEQESNKVHHVQEFMGQKVVILPLSARVDEAAKAMASNHIGCVLVMDSNSEIVGIVTDRDLVCKVLAEEKAGESTLDEVMTERPLYVDEKADLDEVVQIMKEEGVRRVPVCRETESGHRTKCVGIVTLDDLLSAQCISPDDIKEIVQSQIRVRETTQTLKRRRARAQGTLGFFYNRIAEKTGLDRKTQVEDFTKIVLGLLVRRITFQEAGHFITQLPKLLQSDLLDLKSGPDRSIDAQSFVNELSARLGMDRSMAQSCLREFWMELYEHVEPNELEDIKAQLPQDIKELFRMDETSSHILHDREQDRVEGYKQSA